MIYPRRSNFQGQRKALRQRRIWAKCEVRASIGLISCSSTPWLISIRGERAARWSTQKGSTSQMIGNIAPIWWPWLLLRQKPSFICFHQGRTWRGRDEWDPFSWCLEHYNWQSVSMAIIPLFLVWISWYYILYVWSSTIHMKEVTIGI